MALTRPKYSNIVDSDYKASCRIVTTTNISLVGGAPTVYNGVTLVATDRVLVAGQNAPAENGIYVVSTLGTGNNGTWLRSFDSNDGTKLTAGLQTAIGEGSYGGHIWRLTTPDPITVGSTALTFLDAQSTAGGTSTQLQFNNSGALQGISSLTFVAANSTVVSTGNIVIDTLYTDKIRWASNSAAFALTGNINPVVYIGNVLATTSNTLIDSFPYSGNAMVTWTIVSSDKVNSTYKMSTIESVNDGVTTYTNETKVSSAPGTAVATFTSNINGTNVQLWAVGDSATVTVTYERRLLGSSTPVGYINNFGPPGPAGSISATGGNIVTTSSSTATSTTTGALQVAGGAGIGGNLYVGQDVIVSGNITVLGTQLVVNTTAVNIVDHVINLAAGAPSSAAADGSGISVAGALANVTYTAATDGWTSNKNFYAPSVYISGNTYWSGNNAVFHNGINYFRQSTPPVAPNNGDQWYDTSTDILFEWITSDGANSYWVDIQSLAITTTNTGTFTGNLIGNVASDTTVQGNLTVTGLVQTPQLTKTGTSSGVTGQITWDSNYIYVCTSTNVWKRAALLAF